MALETRYDGVFSSDLYDAQTADGFLITDLWQETQDFVAEYNLIKNTLLSFMGYETSKPDADVVTQMVVKWQRFAEWGKPDARSRLETDRAVSTALEGFQTAMEWTDFAEVLGLPARMIRKYIQGVVEGDLQRTNSQLWEQFFDDASRLVEDLLLKKAGVGVVTQLPFYNGDTRVPPRVGNKTFSASHDHYIRSATTAVIVAADLDAQINSVAEHGFDSDLYVFGSQATVDKIMAITGDVIAKIQVVNPIIPRDGVNINQLGALMNVYVPINPLFNVVGVYKGKTKVAVVKDLPDTHFGVFSHEGALSPDNPLQIRTPEVAGLKDLRRVRSTIYPFAGEYWQRMMGISTRQFGNGAATQYVYTGANTDAYEAPAWTYDTF